MAKATKYEAAVLKVEGIGEVRFGKNDKVVAVPIDSDGKNGWTFIGRGGETLRCPTADYPPSICEALVGHGSKQKLKDGTGDMDDIAEMFAYMSKRHEEMSGGNFNGTGGGGGFDSDLVAALMELTGKSDVEVRADLKGTTAAEKDVLRAMPEVAAVITARQAKRTAGVDKDKLLGKFGLVRNAE